MWISLQRSFTKYPCCMYSYTLRIAFKIIKYNQHSVKNCRLLSNTIQYKYFKQRKLTSDLPLLVNDLDTQILEVL